MNNMTAQIEEHTPMMQLIFFLYESGPHFWQTHTETYTDFLGNF